MHHYPVTVEWTGAHGVGTTRYRAYSRDHVIRAGDKPEILGSSDPAFLGDRHRWNPEDLLVASLSACHKLWYLHLCVGAGIVVLAYVDAAEGIMVEETDAGGRFVSATLRPQVTIQAGGDPQLAATLHQRAHACCFIANSVNFPVAVEPAPVIVAPPVDTPSQNPVANDI